MYKGVYYGFTCPNSVDAAMIQLELKFNLHFF